MGFVIGFFFITAVDLAIRIFSPLLGEGSAQLANEWKGQSLPPSRFVRDLTLIPPLVWFFLRSPYFVRRPRLLTRKRGCFLQGFFSLQSWQILTLRGWSTRRHNRKRGRDLEINGCRSLSR